MRYEDSNLASPLAAAAIVFARQRVFAEHCFAQLSDEQFLHRPATTTGDAMNSVAQIANHIAGNLKSRFTNFLAEDGEKPWRNREAEFGEVTDRDAVMRHWAEGWDVLGDCLASLGEDDLQKTVTIRQVPHSVAMAITRQVDHYGYHVGQIAFIGRMLVGDAKWQWFTLAPGDTQAFNDALARRHGK